jgi:thiosulfate reductase electron transport protein
MRQSDTPKRRRYCWHGGALCWCNIEQSISEDKSMNYIMTYDAQRCIGCQACNVGCTNLNSVPDDFARVQVQISKPVDGRFIFSRVSCRQCDNAPCIDVCPTGASYRDEDGIVRVDNSLCISCQYCMSACPYHVRFINKDTQSAEKCNFCADSRLAAGELPACVTVCPTDALKFYRADSPELAQWVATHKDAVYQDEKDDSGKSHIYYRKEEH